MSAPGTLLTPAQQAAFAQAAFDESASNPLPGPIPGATGVSPGQQTTWPDPDAEAPATQLDVALGVDQALDAGLVSRLLNLTTVSTAANTLHEVAATSEGFVGVGQGGLFYAPKALGTWTQRASTLPLGSAMVGGVWTGQNYVLVGPNVIMYSPDGLNWSSALPPNGFVPSTSASAPIGDPTIATDGTGVVVVVGTPRDGGVGLWVSTNHGVTWAEVTSHDLPVNTAMAAVVYGDRFVAIGQGWSTTSVDGVTWTAKVNMGGYSSLCWNGTVYIANGANSGQASSTGISVRSTDGSNWVGNGNFGTTSTAPKMVARTDTGLVVGYNSTMGVASSSIYTSTGTSFTARTPNPSSPTLVVWFASLGLWYCATNAAYGTSPDAITWSAGASTANEYFPNRPGTIIQGGPLGIVSFSQSGTFVFSVSADGNVPWKSKGGIIPSQSGTGQTLSTPLYDTVNSRWWVFPANANASYMSGDDGQTWTMQKRDAALTNYIFGAPGGVPTFVMWSLSSTTIRSSTDGLVWTLRTTAGTTPASDAGMVWTGSRFLFAGTNTGINSVMASADGATWSLVTNPTQQWLALAWNGTSGLAVGRPGISQRGSVVGTFTAASGGITQLAGFGPWSAANLTGCVLRWCPTISKWGLLLRPKGEFWTSADGTSWTRDSVIPFLARERYPATGGGNTDTVTFQASDNEILVAWSMQGPTVNSLGGVHMARSTDGVNWTYSSPVVPGFSTSAQPKLTWNGSTWMFSSGSGTNSALMSSTDGGLTWTPRNRLEGVGPLSTCVAANADGVVVSLGYGDLGWRSANGGIGPGVADFSPDGLLNQGGFIRVPPGYYKSVAAGPDGKFVAVGSGIAIVSADGGLSWATSAIPTGVYRGVTYGGGQFVAVGEYVCATSLDGVTWTARSIPSGVYNSVRAGGQGFVAVGIMGVCATSPDGVVWTAQTTPEAPSSDWYALTWTGKFFVAVGARYIPTQTASPTWGCLAASTDGKTWMDYPNGNRLLCGIDYGHGTLVAVGNSIVVASQPEAVP